MGSKIQRLREEAEKLGIDLDANETISDLEAKIAFHKSTFKVDINEVVLPAPRRQPVNRINFTRRIDREDKDNGTR
jgi:hypothetical protein